MKWLSARDRLRRITQRLDVEADSGSSERGNSGRGEPSSHNARLRDALPTPRAASICIASGKGGTGKSVVSASLATLLSARGRTLIVDADLGVGNAHILQDVSPAKSLVEVVEGRALMRDVLVPCSAQIDLVGAGCGVPRMAALSPYEMHLVATGLREVESDYRHLIFDSAAGVSKQTLDFARVSDVVVLVTTPDLTAMTDAYAFLKVLLAGDPERRPLLLVNRAADEACALEVADRIGRVCRRFLAHGPSFIGWLPDDPEVVRSVNQRSPVVVHAPHSLFSGALRPIAVRIAEELASRHARGAGRRLSEKVAYAARTA